MVGRAWIVLVGAVALALLAAPAALSGPARSDHALEVGVLRQINTLRASHGLSQLRVSPALSAAAYGHSLEMAEDGYFGHDARSGAPFWKRIEAHYPSLGFAFWQVGENLLWSSPSVDPTGALKMWMASPPHRANLLRPGWREIGLSAVHVSAAPGFYGGHEATILTADFGVRR